MIDALKKLKDIALQDSDVIEFIKKYNIPEEEIDKGCLLLYRFVSAKSVCSKCKGLDDCPLESDGYMPLVKYDNHIRLVDKVCKYNEEDPKYLNILYFPYDLPKGDLFLEEDRAEVYKGIKEYMEHPKSGRGLYLHGSFGSGKSFILLNLAKKLSSLGVRTTVIYYPDFARAIKMGVGTFPLEEVINMCKRTDVLMFDDIGGEGNSAYVRDDVLGPILQARMYNNKPVFFTSNLSVDELEKHLADAKDINPVAASRVGERIRATSIEYSLSGKNYR